MKFKIIAAIVVIVVMTLATLAYLATKTPTSVDGEVPVEQVQQ